MRLVVKWNRTHKKTSRKTCFSTLDVLSARVNPGSYRTKNSQSPYCKASWDCSFYPIRRVETRYCRPDAQWPDVLQEILCWYGTTRLHETSRGFPQTFQIIDNRTFSQISWKRSVAKQIFSWLRLRQSQTLKHVPGYTLHKDDLQLYRPWPYFYQKYRSPSSYKEEPKEIPLP